MSASDFTPNQDELAQAVHMLQALRDPLRPDHSMAMKSLQEYLLNSSFILNMLHVFARGGHYEQLGLTFDLRQLAGLVIKNYVFPNLQKLPVDVQQVLKKELVHALNDPNSDIRKTAAILAGKISESFPVSVWCDMLIQIFHMLDVTLYSTHPMTVDGSLQAMKRICEDSYLKLSLDDTNRPLEVLVPKLISLFACPEPSIRVRALDCYNSLLYLLDVNQSRGDSFDDVYDNEYSDKSHSQKRAVTPANIAQKNSSHTLILHMNAFIQAIAVLASDPEADVRRGVCQSITVIASLHVAVLEPFFTEICKFMLTSLQDSVESVAIESCEFWAALLHTTDTKKAMLPFLKPLIENLMTRLYLTNDQMEQERIDEEEENSGAKELNLRPLHHRASAASGASGGNHSASSDSSAKEESDLSAKWTLRKQAALTLDNVALSFPPVDILNCALPKIQEFFQHSDPLVRECGMLALGALSTGCLEQMSPYIPSLFQYWLQNLTDPESLSEIKCITCWVLSRYCSLFAENNGDARIGFGYYELSLNVLLLTMFDPKPKVQVAACSALCLLIEASFYVTVPVSEGSVEMKEVPIISLYLAHIVQVISKAFDVYGVKSSLILIDSIGTLAETVGEDMKTPELSALYLPKLMNKYNQLEDFDMRMFPILECFTSLLAVIGLEAQVYVHAIYTRNLKVLNHIHQCYLQPDQHDIDELPSKDFAVCALDVISALSEGLGDMFVTLVTSSKESHDLLFRCMIASMNDEHAELRQSGFSLSGDICKNSFGLVSQEVAVAIMDCALKCLQPEFPMVCNNAVWTVGELAIQVKGEFMSAYIDRLMFGLINIMQTADLDDNLKVNVAVTIGRLALVCKEKVASTAEEYFAEWCSMLSLYCPLGEKTEAFTGLLHVLSVNPSLLNHKTRVHSFLAASVAAWQEEEDRPPEVMVGLREVIIAIRSHNQTMFNKVLSKFDSDTVNILLQVFHLN